MQYVNVAGIAFFIGALTEFIFVMKLRNGKIEALGFGFLSLFFAFIIWVAGYVVGYAMSGNVYGYFVGSVAVLGMLGTFYVVPVADRSNVEQFANPKQH